MNTKKTTTNKRTHMVFLSKSDKETAVDTLLKMCVKFTASTKLPVVSVSPSLYLGKCLDLYLPAHLSASSFTHKK